MPTFSGTAVVIQFLVGTLALVSGEFHSVPARPEEVSGDAREEEAFPEPCISEARVCPGLKELLLEEVKVRARLILVVTAVLLVGLLLGICCLCRRAGVKEYGSERDRVFRELAAAGVSARTAKRGRHALAL